ncbi:putative membrane protein [Chryseobacterium sp. W4I1]|nr:putative membrane protein [Chryseobacterium sp. W4I1]
MKIFLSILLFIPCYIYSQEYFLLDSLRTKFKVNEYTLNTQEIYNVKKDINVYNVFVSKNHILLISVLSRFG